MTESAANAGKHRLLNVLGLGFGLAVMVGNTIGLGILRTPGEIAALLPSVPWYLLVWVIGAAYALLGALSVSELATMDPRSGGLYPHIHRALGPYFGFVAGWNDWIATCCSMAAVAIVLGEYVAPFYPPLTGKQAWIGGAVVVVFALLQWRGVRVGGAAQQLTSLLKAVALVALALVAVMMSGGLAPQPAPVQPPALLSGLALAGAMVVALQSVIYTYDGWTGPIYFGAEVRNPGRDLPRAMIGGVLLVLVIYLALNLAFLQVVPIEQMAGDPFVAATVAARLLGPAGDSVLRGLMVISLIASISAFQLMASRVPHAMAGDGLLPRRFEQVNAGGTPVVALFAGTLLALGFIATNSFNGVLALLAFFFVANYVLAFVSLFVLRQRQPDAPRPFRVPWYPWVPAAALLGSVVFLLAAMAGDREHSAIAMLVLAASVPAYLLQRRWLPRVSSSTRSD